jgi:hypothetical protein
MHIEHRKGICNAPEYFGSLQQPGFKGELMTIVRRYTTTRIKGGIAFKCERCEYRVTTLDFQSKDGNVRTQAATALNEHALLAHHEPMLVSSAYQQERH